MSPSWPEPSPRTTVSDATATLAAPVDAGLPARTPGRHSLVRGRWTLDQELIDAEALVRRYTPGELAETAEAYFASVKDWTYHLMKPLGSPSEAPTVLAHFGAMLAALQVESGIDLLDFGAGSCWTSRMLTQLGCHVVACDVSPTALAMGKRLFELQPPLGTGSVRFLQFDGITVEMSDESVDRISVMDAFHHVPNWDVVLAEFHRVLRPGGRVVLAEGGPNHSRTPQAQEEMRHFTVVERDMVVEEFAVLAASVGFGETLVGIYAGLPRLVPAARFTEELANGRVAGQVVRSFLDNHRLIVLSKPGQANLTSRGPNGLRAELVIEETDGLRFRLLVRNVGTATWLGWGAGVGSVLLGVQLLGPTGGRVDLDYLRVRLSTEATQVVRPNDEVHVEVVVPKPEISPFRLAFDLVSEGVAWFGNIGASDAIRSEVIT